MRIIEMMSLCSKCGDYYADQTLAFCLADGMPLLEVEEGSDNWNEGARMLEKKAAALRKLIQARRLRRVTLLVLALLTLLAYGLAGKRYIYFVPVAQPSPTQTPTPTPSPSPTPSCSPLPDCSPTPTPTPDCSGDDRTIEKAAVMKVLGEAWKKDLIAECAKVKFDTPTGLRAGEPVLSPIEVTFAGCSALVKVWYRCMVIENGLGPGPGPRKSKNLHCDKRKGGWICRRI